MMKEKKEPIEISFGTALLILIMILVIIISVPILMVYKDIKKEEKEEKIEKYIDSLKVVENTIKVNEEFEDESIASIIGIDINDFKKIKDNYTGKNEDEESYKQTATQNFKILEQYIANNNSEITKNILNGLNNKSIYEVSSNHFGYYRK